MDVSASALLQTVLANSARDGGGMALKPGQVVEATVAAITAEGVAILSIGDTQMAAQLPTPLVVGTALKLQVQTSGAVPQLSLVRAVPPEAAVAAAPLPLASLLDSVTAAIIQVRAAPASGAAAPASAVADAAPVAAPAVGTVPVVLPAGEAVSGQAPAPAASSPTQIVSPALAVSPTAVPVQAVPGIPETLLAQVPAEASPQAAVAPAGGGVDRPTVPTPVSHVAGSPSPPALDEAAALAVAPTANPAVAQAPAVRAPSGDLVAVETQPQVSPATPAGAMQPAPLVSPTAVKPSASAPDASGTVSANQIAAGVVPEMSAEPKGVASAAAAPREFPPTATVPSTQAGESDSGPSLLLAQQAARPVPSAREMNWPPPSLAASRSADAAATPAPTTAPNQPATPAAAVARAVPAALAVQDSLGPLLQTLSALAGSSERLPVPVLRLVRQILAQRVAVGESGPRAEDIAGAVANSGTFLEARLANGRPAGQDLKGLLLALKAALGPAGQHAAAQHGGERASPPLRDLPLRATALPDAPAPSDGPGLVKLAATQTEAALGRVKLAQIAALPDADPRQPVPAYRLELPLLAGAELVMAQMRIAPDGQAPKRGQSRGWSVKFAMNFAAGGEVGADVAILERSVDVGLWAVDEDLAAEMRALLPELGRAIADSGLRPGRLHVRSGAPVAPRPRGGHVVDSLS